MPSLTEPLGAAVTSGTVDLLARTGHRRRRTMTYLLPFTDGDGRRWELRGRKDVWHTSGFDLWRATTTMAATLRDLDTGHEAPAGVLRLSPLGVLPRALSIRATGTTSSAAATRQMGRFLAFFISRIGQQFLPGLAERRPRERRTLVGAETGGHHNQDQ